MSGMKRNRTRKPMPPPSVAHKSWAKQALDSYTNEQIKEAIEDFQYDPADVHGWDWPAPSERDQRLWEIK